MGLGAALDRFKALSGVLGSQDRPASEAAWPTYHESDWAPLEVALQFSPVRSCPNKTQPSIGRQPWQEVPQHLKVLL